jgi:hypothetical protein
MSSLDQKANTDCEYIIQFINNHENKNGIVSMFMKGPPKDKGFSWCSHEDKPYWTDEESNGLKVIRDLVLDKEWDSSGYGLMMRKIQQKIRTNQLRRSPPLFQDNLPTAIAIPINNLDDDEGKCSEDYRTGLGSPLHINNLSQQDNGRSFARAYQQTRFGKSMNDKNKEALKVAAEQGFEASAKFMMEQAGGDYARMRSMYG